MRISFHGADRGVTGSCHLLEVGGRKILVDCGLYQGGREIELENAAPFGFDPAAIDFLLLTHAHLDHCGRIPLLRKRGFRGEIVTTSASRELARLVMLDSAHIQEEDALHRARAAERSHGSRVVTGPLYTLIDTLDSLDAFGRAAEYDMPLELSPGVTVTFIEAGHILGSASLVLDIEEGGERRRILFSGDLGNAGRPLLRPPAIPPRADIVIMETTYADRVHKPMPTTVDELYFAVGETLQRGGNVLIPTFALERAQELLYFLRVGMDSNKLSPSIQVFLDSPMAISATEIFRRHRECFEPRVAMLFEGGGDPFALPGLHFTRESSESIALNRVRGGAIIMAGSGMCAGGRVRHHLKHNLWRPDASVIFVGFAAVGTLAREIIDGAREVDIFGERVAVRARIHTINGFSAHADQAALLAWHGATRAKRTFLVHGEEEVMRGFAARLGGAGVTCPALGESFEL